MVAQSCLTVLQPHGLQHTWLPCSSTISQSLLRLMSIESVMPSNHLILCRHLLFLPSVFPSIRVFSNELTLRISWPKVLKLHLQHQSFSEYSGLIFFRIDWFDLLAVQGTFRSLLQHHSSKASSLLYGLTLTSLHDYWKNHSFEFMELQFSHSVMSDSLQPHGLQHARLPCPSPTPGACSNTCPLNR